MNDTTFNISYDRKHGTLDICLDNCSTVVRLGDLLATFDIDDVDCRRLLDSSNKNISTISKVIPADLLQLNTIPHDLSGRRVLDIGGYDGYVAHRCLENGAESAVVVDSQQFVGYTLPSFPYGWILPKGYPGVKYVIGDLMDITPWIDDALVSDLIICFNVIYHITNPLKAMENLRLLTKHDLYLSTSVNSGDTSSWNFNPDPCRRIFFTPTRIGLERMLQFVGFEFEKLADDGHEVVYKCW